METVQDKEEKSMHLNYRVVKVLLPFMSRPDKMVRPKMQNVQIVASVIGLVVFVPVSMDLVVVMEKEGIQ